MTYGAFTVFLLDRASLTLFSAPGSGTRKLNSGSSQIVTSCMIWDK